MSDECTRSAYSKGQNWEGHKNVVIYFKPKIFFMKHLIILLSFVFISLGIFTANDNINLQTGNGCKLITCTKAPVIKKSRIDAETVADDYYQPLSPISRFILL